MSIPTIQGNDRGLENLASLGHQISKSSHETTDILTTQNPVSVVNIEPGDDRALCVRHHQVSLDSKSVVSGTNSVREKETLSVSQENIPLCQNENSQKQLSHNESVQPTLLQGTGVYDPSEASRSKSSSLSVDCSELPRDRTNANIADQNAATANSDVERSILDRSEHLFSRDTEIGPGIQNAPDSGRSFTNFPDAHPNFSNWSGNSSTRGDFNLLSSLPSSLAGGFEVHLQSKNSYSSNTNQAGDNVRPNSDSNSSNSMFRSSVPQPSFPLGHALRFQQQQQQCLINASIQSTMGPMLAQIGDFCSSSKQAMEDHKMQLLDAQNRQRALLEDQLANQNNQIANLQSFMTNLAQPGPDPGFSPHSADEVQEEDVSDCDQDRSDVEVLEEIHYQVEDEVVPRDDDSSVVDLSAFLLPNTSSLPSSSVFCPDSSKAIPSASKRSSTVKEAMSSERIFPIFKEVGLHADLLCLDGEKEEAQGSLLFGSLQSRSKEACPTLRMPAEIYNLWDEIRLGKIWKAVGNKGVFCNALRVSQQDYDSLFCTPVLDPEFEQNLLAGHSSITARNASPFASSKPTNFS